MKHIFIINAISGKGLANKLVPIIETVIDELGIDGEIIKTTHPNHAYEIASNYHIEDDVTIYAVGGDGTIYEVLNGLNKDVPLAIIPSGSGNDFYRIFNSDIKDYHKLIVDTIKAPLIRIDYGIANDSKFINTTSIGIDADITAYASKLIRNTFITKGPAYFLSIIKNVIIPKAKKLKIQYDNCIEEGEYYISCIMNGRYYGNGANSAPNSKLDDGYFDFIITKKYPIFEVYLLLGKYLKGKHLNDKHFNIVRAKHIHIESDEILSIQSDGESIDSNILDIRIIEKGLLFKVPLEYHNKL